MGLDIVAYRGLKPAPEAETDADGYVIDDRYTQFSEWIIRDWVEKYWPGRSKGLKPGIYEPAGQWCFHAGSYSGYGEWRNLLARFAGYATAKDLWFQLESGTRLLATISSGGPFVELIHFADNQGVIGPVVAAKLAKDFRDHLDKAKVFSPDEWWFRLYLDWLKAFEMAADGGAVSFH